LKSSFYLGIVVSPFALIIEKLTDWYISNQVTIFFICGAILIDWLSGIGKHVKLKTFSWKLNGIGLLVKTGMVICGSFLSEAMPHFLGDNLLSYSLITVLRLSIFMYPAGSGWMNMSVITNGKFPPVGWINRIKSFQENLNIKDLTNDNKGETN